MFSNLTTVGTLFGLLRYVHWMQQGMKQASNAYARIMAGLGEWGSLRGMVAAVTVGFGCQAG